MPGNSFGQLFRVTTCGESHGEAIAAIVDGCPPGLILSENDIQFELDRRVPGQSVLTTQRKENDRIKILSGVLDGQTLGTPILLLAVNDDAKPEAYEALKYVYRPSHADYTYDAKYGRRDWRGGGRASARETLARVAAGAIAKKYLKEKLGVEILSFTEQIGSIKTDIDFSAVNSVDIERNSVRCPDAFLAQKMIALIEEVKRAGDSVGGIIRGVIKNVPVGLGEPVFDKLSADLGKAMLSIGAVKGFEIGSGFAGAALRGSGNNDSFYVDASGHIRTKTNNAGGVLGGISSGEPITFRVAFKPTATIGVEQETVTKEKISVKLKTAGQHDSCILPRAVPIVDAMAALVITDHYLRHKAQNI